MRIKTLFFGLAIAALTAAGCTSATGGSGGRWTASPGR